MNLRSLGALGIAAALLLGTACGGDDDGGSDVDTASEGTTETTAGGAAASDNGGGSKKGCDLLTKAELDAAFGADFGAADDTSTGTTTMCNWSSLEPVVGFTYVIQPSSASQFDATVGAAKKAGHSNKSVSGVGDKAIVARADVSGAATFQVYATKGGELFYTTSSAHDLDAAKVESASVELAKKVAAKL